MDRGSAGRSEVRNRQETRANAAVVSDGRHDAVEPGECAVCSHTAARAARGSGGEGHRHDQEQGRLRRRVARLALSALLSVAGIALEEPLHTTPYALAEWAVLLSAYLLAGGPVVLAAVRHLRRGRVFDENTLMTVATLGAMAIHALPEAVAVMLFYSVGELSQDLALGRARRSIAALLELRPEVAHLKVGQVIQDVPPERVQPGDTVVVRPGERVPLDGVVVEGTGEVDTSALTGESVPRFVEAGQELLAGMVSRTGLFTLHVTRPFGASSLARILALVEQASYRKAPTERFITTFSRYYTPAVVLAAVAVAVVPPLIVAGATWSTWIYRALVLLVISCPCALVLSVPLSYFGGLGAAARNGVLVKGANFLDALTGLRAVVFDKTGTLTRGVFKVTEVRPAPGHSRDAVLAAAALAEAQSRHPIARSILEAYGQEVDLDRVGSYEEVPGHGVRAVVDGEIILAGNDRWMHRAGVPHSEHDVAGTAVHVAKDGRYLGYVVISDEIREDAPAAIEALRALGVRRLVMLTGDSPTIARRVAERLGLDAYEAGLLPEQKVERLERILASRDGAGAVAFVGDGINDAAVISRADVGIAMGGLGSDAAIEAADVVIMEDRLSRLPVAIRVARFTRRLVVQNIGLALGVKLLFATLGALGLSGIWGAVVADVGVSLVAVLNATRVLRARLDGATPG